MHSSLPQQLSNFAFSRSRLLVGAFSAIERLVIRARGSSSSSAASRGGGPRHRPGRPTWCSSRTRPARATSRRDGGRHVESAAVSACPAGDADRALHRHVRGLPGARPAVRGVRVVRRGAPGRAVRARRRAAPTRSTGAPQRRPRRASARRDLRRPAARRGDSGVSRCGRRAGLAAQPRHEHAAEDLPVPPRRPADRRDAPADAHAGARRRGGGPDRGDARGLPRASCRPSTIAGDAAAAEPARRHLAETKYSYEAYLERTRRRRPCAAGCRPPQVAEASAAREPRRTTTATRCTRTRRWPSRFDALRFSGPIGTTARRRRRSG